MRILLTGGTGFLGKTVLRQLSALERVEHIYALTRQQVKYPHEKVTMLQCDLCHPTGMSSLELNFDVVVHLAGSYNLGEAYNANYLNNVVATQHLLSGLLARANGKLPHIHFASTYAVGQGMSGRILEEVPISALPPRHHSYALSKALTEKLLLESVFPVHAYRLGILVGQEKDGSIEKIDGPYYLLRLLRWIRKLPLASKLPAITIPANPDQLLPLVPVDAAANVIVEGVLNTEINSEPERKDIFGVFNTKSIRVREFVESSLEHYGYHAAPLYFTDTGYNLLRWQQKLTGVPATAFDFALNGPRLSNDIFQKRFGPSAVPDFSHYQKAFFQGFHQFIAGANA